MASYATPAEMQRRFDWRIIGDLVADDANQVSASDQLTNNVLLDMLADASGEIESALIVGNRYSTADLEGLTGNSANTLVRLTCELAYLNLTTRRGEKYVEDNEPLRKSVMDRLERLRKGENVLNLQPQKDASLVHVTGPTTLGIEQLNLMRDRVGTSFYPARRMPYGR